MPLIAFYGSANSNIGSREGSDAGPWRTSQHAQRAGVRKPPEKERAGSRALPGTAQRYEDFDEAAGIRAGACITGEVCGATQKLAAVAATA